MLEQHGRWRSRHRQASFAQQLGYDPSLAPHDLPRIVHGLARSLSAKKTVGPLAPYIQDQGLYTSSPVTG